jgi:glucarate dehydratase
VRAAIGPDAVLRLDANNSWPLNTARRALRRLEPFDIANIEDSAPTFHDMAKLRQHSAIPFSSHLPDLRLAVELGVPDTFVLNVMTLGGLRETMKFISACELMGVGFWFYSGETAVGTAAYMQLVASIPYLSQPGQSLFRWYADDVGPELIQPYANAVPIPDGPGLGVAVDPQALQRCKERYARSSASPAKRTTGNSFSNRISCRPAPPIKFPSYQSLPSLQRIMSDVSFHCMDLLR